MKLTLLTSLFSLATLLSASAVNYTNTWDIFPQGNTVFDNDPLGWQDTRTVDLTNEAILSIRVTLDMTGGWNGDMYARLTHGTNYAVLLNRSGVTDAETNGYGDTGFQVTFDDIASTNDVHLYRDVSNPGGGVLSGTWASDGRDIDPAVVRETDLRLFTLDQFLGVDADGDWTLFLCDNASLEEMTVNSWGCRVVFKTGLFCS